MGCVSQSNRNPSETDSAFQDSLVALGGELSGFVHALLRGRGSAQEADDLVQESLTRALQFQHQFDPKRPLWPWLKRIAFRVMLDSRRRQRPGLLEDSEQLAAEPTSDRLADNDEVSRRLTPLKAQERDILLRFHQDEQSIDDIARALSLKPGTVKSLLHRARRKVARWNGGPA